MTPRQANVLSGLVLVVGLMFLMSRYGGSYPLGWSLIGGVVIAAIIRAWMALTMRTTAKLQKQTEGKPATRALIMMFVTPIAGAGALWMGNQTGVWLMTLVGWIAILVGTPFFVWDWWQSSKRA